VLPPSSGLKCMVVALALDSMRPTVISRPVRSRNRNLCELISKCLLNPNHFIADGQSVSQSVSPFDTEIF
jgi:hypothetical protein